MVSTSIGNIQCLSFCSDAAELAYMNSAILSGWPFVDVMHVSEIQAFKARAYDERVKNGKSAPTNIFCSLN
jgi:hypothetical protein